MPAEAPPRVVRLAGWALIFTWLAIVAAVFLKYGSCGDDSVCEDGRRAGGMGMFLASPFAALGVMLLVAGGSGWPTSLLRWVAGATGALLGVIAIILLLHALGRFVALWSGRPLSGNLNDLQEARAGARSEGIATAIAGVLIAGVAAGGFLPLLSGSDSPLARRLASAVLVGLLVFSAGIGIIGLIAYPINPETVAITALGLIGLGGAAYALTRAWALDPSG